METKSTRKPSPELKASIFSLFTWTWISPLVSLGNQKPLQAEDLYDMNPKESAAYCEQLWIKATEKHKNASVWRLLWECYGMEYLKSSIYKPICLIAAIMQAYIIKATMKAVGDPYNFKWWWGAVLVLSMFIASITYYMAQHMCLALSEKVGMKIRSTVSIVVFNKLLSMKSVYLAGTNKGQMLNIVTNDTQVLLDAAKYLHAAWFGLVEMFIVGILVIVEAGLSAIPGVLVVLLTQPLLVWMAHIARKLRQEVVKYTDTRVHVTGEIINGIRVIKYNGWVLPFVNRIANIRRAELSRLYKLTFVKCSPYCICESIAPLASLATFGTYYLTHEGNIMPTSQVFTVLLLLSVMSRSMIASPVSILAGGESIIALQRLQKLVDLDKISSFCTTSAICDVVQEHNEDKQISIVHGSFSWEMSKNSCTKQVNIPVNFSGSDGHVIILKDVNLTVREGELIGIYGPVGSGKSSLLLAILDEMQLLKGEAFVQRDIAYVPQQPWIYNDTIRGNIIFTNQYDPDRYERTITACALKHDVSQFVGGHDAELGERGINLSGGQKARIGLARACYSRTRVVLLDDPFSAVDVPTTKYLVEHVLNGVIKDRTVVLVTHNMAVLKACNRVYYMENGNLIETTKTLMEQDIVGDSCAYAPLKKTEISRTCSNNNTTAEYESVNGNELVGRNGDANHISQAQSDLKKGRTTVIEDRSEGELKLSTWILYAKECGGVYFFSFVMFFFIIAQPVRVMADYWLRIWSEKRFHLQSEVYVASYACIVIGASVLLFFRVFLLRHATIIAATRLHNKMIERVLRAPQLFFDQNVPGRIMNRFSKDQSIVDEILPAAAQETLESIMPAVGSLVMTGILIPWFLLMIPPFCVFCIYIRYWYAAISRELKRLEAISRSPMYSHFLQTLEGIVSVRAYGSQSHMHETFISLIDQNHRPYILFAHMTRWLGVRLDFVTSLALTFATLLVLLQKNTISPGIAGVILAQIMQATTTLQFGVRQIAETENNLTSVERMEAYTHLTSEAEPTTQPGIIDLNWPSKGEIEFKEYTMTYRVDLPPVLKNLSFKVNAGEKVGILGRTGVGKSSIIAAIFRMVENEKCSGNILIDGINLKAIGLDDLRQRLSIIPQDPILFQGTLRSNLDPFQTYPDVEIHEALQNVRLSEKIPTLNGGLDSLIAKDGENISVGQRQLICLTRSLLRRSKVVVMDEATASIDEETDKHIQETIKTTLSACTVLTIAHRIETIINCDRVLVLKTGGVIAEFDSPINLLNHQPEGLFSEMVRQTGPIVSQKLYEAAQAAALAATGKD